MALIKCPECGKDISDLCEVCIHCGYPIKIRKIQKFIIGNTEYDLSFVLKNDLTSKEKIKKIQKISSCSLKEAMTIVHNIYDDYNIIDQQVTKKDIIQQANNNQVKCPKCGSTSITTGARGVNQFWGLLGASKTVNRCANCGHTWKPSGR
jgi:predicted RNA-binding Zn-ribbon protein involved in translation (DUF1610 family)